MGGCIQGPCTNKDMMEEHKAKGFDDWMDRAPVKESYSNVPQAGWFELGVSAVVVVVAIIIAAIFFH